MVLLGSAEDQDHAAAGASRAPEPVVVVAADRRRCAGMAAEEVDGSSLAVVARHDDRRRAVRWGQRASHAHDLMDQLVPPEHVGEELWQRADLVPLAGGGL